MFMNMIQLGRGITTEHNNQADNVLLEHVIPLFSPYKQYLSNPLQNLLKICFDCLLIIRDSWYSRVAQTVWI